MVYRLNLNGEFCLKHIILGCLYTYFSKKRLILQLLELVFHRCPRYSDLPAQCKLIPDFRNPCCKVPDCGFDGTLTSISGQDTLAPPMPGQPTPSPNPLNPNPNPTPNIGVPVLSKSNFLIRINRQLKICLGLYMY